MCRVIKVLQYRWALRHPVVKDAITKALANRFPARLKVRFKGSPSIKI